MSKGVIDVVNEWPPILPPRFYDSVAPEQQKQPMTVKDTNPKDAVGIRKPPTSTVSSGVMSEVGVAMLEGARKYGRHNYRIAGVRASVYKDALDRHINAWWDYGQDIDPASGLHHVTKAIASLFVLRDAMINDKCIDDRPPSLPIEHLDELQKRVDEIFDRYPDAKPAYTREDTDAREYRK